MGDQFVVEKLDLNCKGGDDSHYPLPNRGIIWLHYSLVKCKLLL